MNAPAAAPPGAPPTAEARARKLRLAGILFLAAAVGGVAWFARRSGPSDRDPAGVFDYVRERILAGDAEAPWRLMLPKAREKYAGFVRLMATRDDDPAARAWRRGVGLAKEDLLKLPPEKVMAHEIRAFGAERYRNARVVRVDRYSEDEALLYINLGGDDRYWMMRRVDGAWRVEDPMALITREGIYSPGGGETGRKLPIPPDESAFPSRPR